MRIGVDCRLSGRAHAGIGRYIENLIERLPGLAPDVEWVYFFSSAEQVAAFKPERFQNVTAKVAAIRHYSVAEQLFLPGIFSAAQLDLLHIPHFNVPIFYRGKMVVTIHDLLWHEYRGREVTTLSPWMYWLKYVAYRFIASRAVSKAVKVFVPANTIKKTLDQYYPQKSSKVVVTKEGVGEVFTKAKDDNQTLGAESTEKVSYQANAKTLVYVGSLYPHKNIQVVIQALKKLPEYRLLLIGSRSIFQEKTKKLIEKNEVHNQVVFAGYVSDEDLVRIYTHAFALVQPSLSEGFGLTGVEAMAAGCPVLASNIPIFNEIYQDAVGYFNPLSPDSFIKAVRKLEAQPRAKVAQRGQKISRNYSWDDMSQQTLMQYLSVLKQ